MKVIAQSVGFWNGPQMVGSAQAVLNRRYVPGIWSQIMFLHLDPPPQSVPVFLALGCILLTAMTVAMAMVVTVLAVGVAVAVVLQMAVCNAWKVMPDSDLVCLCLCTF